MRRLKTLGIWRRKTGNCHRNCRFWRGKRSRMLRILNAKCRIWLRRRRNSRLKFNSLRVIEKDALWTIRNSLIKKRNSLNLSIKNLRIRTRFWRNNAKVSSLRLKMRKTSSIATRTSYWRLSKILWIRMSLLRRGRISSWKRTNSSNRKSRLTNLQERTGQVEGPWQEQDLPIIF